MILIIDYGMGNLRSVAKAFSHLGANVRVDHDPALIAKADKIVVPGVGSFDHAVHELKKRSLFEPLTTAIREGKPYLGLCLGLQLLFDSSAEGQEQGFGIVSGKVEKFPQGLKVPHMGWNQVEFVRADCPYWKGLENRSYFYFVHSYYVVPEDESVREGSTEYRIEFTSALWKENVFATQFHPEKSQENGLRLLKNYIEN